MCTTGVFCQIRAGVSKGRLTYKEQLELLNHGAHYRQGGRCTKLSVRLQLLPLSIYWRAFTDLKTTTVFRKERPSAKY